MTFIEKFEQQCRIRGEKPCSALERAGLSKSLWTKWKRQPDRTPYADTIQKLATYFGCPFESLVPDGVAPSIVPSGGSDTFTAIVNCVAGLSEDNQKHLLSYILFTYRKELPDAVQKLRQ